MDPPRAPGESDDSRLPRTRGDGPQDDIPGVMTSLAPPHTRGWTLNFVKVRHFIGGSPAHAGMDPHADGGAV